MARFRVPFSAARRRRLIRWLGAAVLLWGVTWRVVVYMAVRYFLRPYGFAVPVAAYVTASLAVLWVFSGYVNVWAAYRSRLGWHLVVGCLFGTALGTCLLASARADWSLPGSTTVTLALAVTILGALYCLRLTRRGSLLSLARQVRRTIPRKAARETYTACQRLLDGDRLRAERRKVVMLNMAKAAIARSVSDDAPDGLLWAVDILRELIEDPPADWLMVLAAAMDLVDASYVKSDKHNDFAGYPQALGLLADVAQRMPADFGAAAIAHHKRAEHQIELALRLPGPAASASLAEAVASLRAAIDAVSPHLRNFLPTLHADLGTAVALARADPGDLEAGIAECRIALRLAGVRLPARAYAQFSLGKLLTDRASEAVARVPADATEPELQELAPAILADLARAERLLRRARRFGAATLRGMITSRLADARMARATVLDRAGARRQAIRSWRSAARTAARDEPFHRVRVAKGWVGWAEGTQKASWCAEAYWCLMKAVPPAVTVRYLPAERDRVLADIQSSAEEAGYWLAEAGRVADAALALELGRAVSLTEVLGRDQPGLDRALRQAGRADLLERYRAAVDDYGAAARGGRGDGHGLTAQRAWARYDELRREVTAVTGRDLPGAVPKLAELAAAAQDGRVVYLAAAKRGGYAVIVPPAGRPTYLPLPRLTRAEVAGRLPRYLEASGLREIAAIKAEVSATARWLWTAGIDALAHALPTGALITIVPVGLLGLLPVHAAGGPSAPAQEPADWTFLADRVRVRYAPNARTLLRCQATANDVPDQALNMLAVAAPHAVPSQPLPHAADEVRRISRLWRQGTHAHPIIDGTLADVKRLLGSHGAWHLACHCHAEPERILDSSLTLTGGDLSLRDILAMPPAPRRLAVLSACNTHWTGDDLPDEAISLPTGLLQAGFAGVIASHWAVSDWSTAVLMTRFHDLWRNQGLAPSAALAEAQHWLRTATHADLRACYRNQLRRTGSPAGFANQREEYFRHPFFWAAFALTGH